MNDNQNQRHEDCLKFYIEQNGRDHARIELKMRHSGHPTFNRRVLYGRNRKGLYKPGWIKKFGWKEAARSGDTPVPTDAAAASGNRKHLGPRSAHICRPDNYSAATRTPKRHPCGQECPRSFPAWLKQVSPELTWDWKYQKYIYKHLQRVTDGTCKRLMIFMPPRHGKSELVTVRYAGWRLWNDPKMKIIVSSYNQKLADKFSRSIRKLLSEEEDKQSAVAAAGPTFPSPAAPFAGREGSAFPNAFSNEKGGSASADALVRQPAEYPQCSGGGTAAEHFSSDPGKAEPSRSAGGLSPNDAAQAALHQSKIPSPKSKIERVFPKTRTVNTSSQWETALGGGVKAVGVGAGVTGFGGQLIIIDDPVKSRAEAESETYRERLWDWYRSDLYTRLEPGASVVLIQTRWHQNDLAGRLLEEMKNGGDPWEVIDLPALSEPRAVATGEVSTTEAQRHREENGKLSAETDTTPLEIETSIECLEQTQTRSQSLRLCASVVKNPSDPLGRPVGKALCPDRFDEIKLADIQRQLGSYAFSALYQQHPTPAEGGIFKRAWFKQIVDRAPEGLAWKRGYDLAVSTKTSSCYTASFRVAYDADGCLYIADGFRRRIEYPEQRRYLISRLADEPDTEHGVEKALHGEAIIQDLRREPAIRGSNLRGIVVATDKLTRALKWAPLAEEGKVILVRGTWNTEFLEEVLQFPNGQFNDQVDAVSLAVSMFRTKSRTGFSF